MEVNWKRRDIIQHGATSFVVIGRPPNSLPGIYRAFRFPAQVSDSKEWAVANHTLDYSECVKAGTYSGPMPDEGYIDEMNA